MRVSAWPERQKWEQVVGIGENVVPAEGKSLGGTGESERIRKTMLTDKLGRPHALKL